MRCCLDLRFSTTVSYPEDLSRVSRDLRYFSISAFSIEKNDLTAFPVTTTTLNNLKLEERTLLKKSIKEHFFKLQEGINKYSPFILTADYDWMIASDEDNINNAKLTCSEKILKGNLSTYVLAQFLNQNLNKWL